MFKCISASYSVIEFFFLISNGGHLLFWASTCCCWTMQEVFLTTENCPSYFGLVELVVVNISLFEVDWANLACSLFQPQNVFSCRRNTRRHFLAWNYIMSSHALKLLQFFCCRKWKKKRRYKISRGSCNSRICGIDSWEQVLSKFSTLRDMADVIIWVSFGEEKLRG